MRPINLIIPILFLFVVPSNAQNYKFGKVSEEEVLQEEHPINKDASAAVLFRSQKVYYEINQHEGFNLITEVHERVKIYNKEAFDWATKEIKKIKSTSDEESLIYLKGYTYNLVDGELEEEKLRNDEIFEEDESKYRRVTKFTMPAVTEGSVIEYTYKIKSPFIGSIGKTLLQYTIPIDRLELDVKIPEYFFFSRYQNLRSPLSFKLKESKESFKYSFTTTNRHQSTRNVRHSTSRNKIEYMMNMYSIEKNDIPALKKETHIDDLRNYAAFIDWELQYTRFPNSTVENYSETWEGVAKSIYNDLGMEKEISKNSFYDEDLDKLITGLSDPMMKAEKIYDFVKQKVKWNEYLGFFSEEGTKKAYKEGSGNIGDINLLLISMLRYANLKAHPVLVSTPSNGIPIFPTRDGFNYVIAALNIGDRVILLDASDPTSGIGELPKRARNWQGRLLKDEGVSDWINLMPSTLSENSVKMNLKFEDSRLVGRNLFSYSGLSAKKFRDDHIASEINNGIDDRISTAGEVEISDYKIQNKNNLGKEITESFNFELKGITETIGDKVYIQPLMFGALKENPFKSDERSYPVFFDFPKIKSHSVNIMIPEGYKIISLPESLVVQLGDDDGEFRFVITGNKKIVRIVSHVSLNKIIFKPEEYDILKKFYDNIIKKQSEAIVLEKELEDGLEERAESGR